MTIVTAKMFDSEVHFLIIIPLFIASIDNENDRSFMEKLYIKYYVKMFGISLSLSDSKQDAEDAVSSACISLIKKISLLQQFDCNVLEGYVISTVKNASYAIHRKRSRSPETIADIDGDYYTIPDENSENEFLAVENASISDLKNAINKLDCSEQLVIRMKYFEHATDKEIGDILGIKEVSVRSKLTRARKKLHDLLEEGQNEK